MVSAVPPLAGLVTVPTARIHYIQTLPATVVRSGQCMTAPTALYMKFGVWLLETSSASAGENPII